MFSSEGRVGRGRRWAGEEEGPGGAEEGRRAESEGNEGAVRGVKGAVILPTVVGMGGGVDLAK